MAKTQVVVDLYQLNHEVTGVQVSLFPHSHHSPPSIIFGVGLKEKLTELSRKGLVSSKKIRWFVYKRKNRERKDYEAFEASICWAY